MTTNTNDTTENEAAFRKSIEAAVEQARLNGASGDEIAEVLRDIADSEEQAYRNKNPLTADW